MKYDHKKIEAKWQRFWEKNGTYKDYSRKNKFYALDMFPYPSGAGLHVGHPKGYIATDVFSRYKMLRGFSVLHPMGWDAFGLPAENYAIANKIHPRVAVEQNIATFKKQLEKFGFTYNWDREINTTDPEYYKWTQWAFLKMFEKGLAYQSDEAINWCPNCKTGLALEDLEGGVCERCGTEVVQKKVRQWVLKMTAYADRLLYDLDKEKLDWEDSILEQQRNWIGRSEGAQFKMKIITSTTPASGHPSSAEEGTGEVMEVFTTRLDTVFGMTFALIAPEHQLVQKLKDKITNWNEVAKYIEQAQKKTDLQRQTEIKEKTGVELKGVKVINPFTKQEIPLFASDFVLAHYGTGAVMAVPAHDERDFDFARKFGLPIKEVVAPVGKGVIGVGALIEVEKGQFIFQERDEKTDKNPNMIAPFGGGIEKKENDAEALARELKEELGLEIDSNKIFVIAKVASQNTPGKFINMFYVPAIGAKLSVKEGRGSVSLTLGEALENERVTDFTKEVIKIFKEENNFAFTDDGILVNSGEYNDLLSVDARKKMTQWLEKEKIGQGTVNYKMRDWVFSRQRYWGEPIPIIHCQKCGAVAVPYDELPLKLPEVKKYEPTGTGEGPLAGIAEWVNTKCPKCGGPGKRETNTMPQWAGSSWYFLRYIDPKNKQALVDKQKEKEWMPVDLYVGGAEHATRHLLYARFWHKFLYDIGAVSTPEPFQRLIHVGLIQAEDGRKMSKRWDNVINPDDVIAQYGADSIRLYEMFMGPFTQNIAWSTKNVIGVRRFLERVWKFYQKLELTDCDASCKDAPEGMPQMLHKTIKKVTEDIEEFHFNTAISQMMIFINFASQANKMPRGAAEAFLVLLAPFAPHMAEELWFKLGYDKSIFIESWPKYNPALVKDETISLPVQVNGRVRLVLSVPADISEEEAKKLVLSDRTILKWLEGKEPKKVIFVKGRLVNIVLA